MVLRQRGIPGNVNELAAARENVLSIVRPFTDAMPMLADGGYDRRRPRHPHSCQEARRVKGTGH
jgi:hypothetical protein